MLPAAVVTLLSIGPANRGRGRRGRNGEEREGRGKRARKCSSSAVAALFGHFQGGGR